MVATCHRWEKTHKTSPTPQNPRHPSLSNLEGGGSRWSGSGDTKKFLGWVQLRPSHWLRKPLGAFISLVEPFSRADSSANSGLCDNVKDLRVPCEVEL